MLKDLPIQKDKHKLEGTIMRQLEHPFIISFIEEVTLNHHICVVMEYCGSYFLRFPNKLTIGGGTLFDKINQQGKISEAESVRLFAQIVDAVEYLHSKKIVHRGK